MIKKYLLYAVAGICFSSTLSNTAMAQFVQVPVLEAPVREIQEQENYLPELAELMGIQAIQQKISILKDLYSKTESERKQKDIADRRYKAMEECNINLLADVYEDPANAWKNITNEYDNQEMEMTLSILDAMPKKLHTGEEIRTEQLAHWYLGKEVLESVYASPEKYGKLKDGKTFPLWKDQEYLYNQDVSSFIQRINSRLGRNGKIPGVSSQNSYAENENAFQQFLKSLSAKELARLPEDLRTLPKPPKALPPANEILLMMDDPSQSKSVFPAWPEPWKKFVNSDFEKYNPNGEMADIFESKSLVVKDEYKHMNIKQKNNRLNVYQGLRKAKNVSQKNYDGALAFQNESAQSIIEDLKSIGISSEINAEDISSLDTIQNQLIEKKQAYIKEIRTKITQNQKKNPSIDVKDGNDFLKEFALLPHAQQMEKLKTIERGSDTYVKASNIINATQTQEHLNYIDALEKDLNGELLLSTFNATQVDHLKNEKEAEKALYEEIAKEEEKTFQNEFDLKIDSQCLNGGI